jgi:hypothetical protein
MLDHNKQCLLLNADFMPMSVIPWTKAIIWYMRYENNKKYGIDIIDFYKNDFINGVNNKKYPIPCVAKTKRFFKRMDSRIIFSKKNIFLRDDYTCQYCDQQFDEKELTYDHVMPKSKWNYDLGSPTIWTNIVTACLWCNRKKGNKTPKQANMPLKNLPIEPNKNIRYLPIAHHLRKIKYRIPQEWYIYLPTSYIKDA